MKKILFGSIKKATVALLCVGSLFFLVDSLAQRKKKDKKNDKETESPAPRHIKSKNGIIAYYQELSRGAESTEGLFTVHKLDNKYYYEIPVSIMGREMLMVTTIA